MAKAKPKPKTKPKAKKPPKPKAEKLVEQPPPAPLAEPRPLENHPALNGKAESGWAKMKASGRRGIMITCTAEQYATFERAAEADNRKLASWCLLQCIRATDI